MRGISVLVAVTICIGSCTTSTTTSFNDPRIESTLRLCRVLANNSDQQYRSRAAEVLVKRGVTAEKCLKLIQNDNSMATSIAVAGAAVAAGAAAVNGGGGYYPRSRAYGVAWDRFYDQYGNPMWRCRDRSNGQFVYDYYCGGMPMIDNWPN
jgi:hypothetical protein